MQRDEVFEAARPALMALGYRMLGERFEAEDLVQETWLRWAQADQAAIKNPAAWLRRVASRLALDQLRSARVRRETYVGPWLPEPLVEVGTAQVETAFEQAQECELALAWAMERLRPAERLAFVLRDAFDAEYAEIASVLDRSETACRQLVARGRKAVKEAGPKFDTPPPVLADVIGRFFAAVAAEDHAAVLALMAQDAVALSDGGATVRAARRPLVGPEEILQVYGAIMEKEKGNPAFGVRMCAANRAPAILRTFEGRPDSVFTVGLNRAGKIAWLYVMRNPEKLAAIALT